MVIIASVALIVMCIRLSLDILNVLYYRQKIEELLKSDRTRFIDVFSVTMAKEFLKRRAG